MTEDFIDLTRVTKDIRVMRGDSWSLEGHLKDADLNPIDLTGATIVAQIRTSFDSSSSVAMDATITDDANGIFVFGQEEALTQGVYDVQITTSGGATRTYLGGKIVLSKDVTRV